MERRHIAIVCGTRPEVIKLAPVFRALRASRRMRVSWIHTGQHDAMARDMLRCFDIVPMLQFARAEDSLHKFSASCRVWLDMLREQQRWDACIVQGDTESAFLGALCAFYGQVPVVHVEAGLRTNDLARPFPEEGIRQMISRICTLHLAPTRRAAAALLKEGADPASVVVTGNTVVDAQHWICARHGIRRPDIPGRGHILVTAHRREHWGAEMEQMFRAIADIAVAYPHTRILFPVHLNPLVQNPARAILGGLPNVELAAPLGYVQMQRALCDASLLLTDSGGLQEEAPTFGVPTLVLRKETERPEAVEAGCAALVGPGRREIVAAVRRLMDDPAAAQAMRRAANPFGDGHAAERTVAAVERLLGLPLLQPLASARLPRRVAPGVQAIAASIPHAAVTAPLRSLS